MKLRNNFLFTVTILTSLLLFSCGGSIRGKWSDEDKQAFRKDMSDVKELSNFGENKDAWITCYLNKCEQKYHSYFMANLDEKGCEKIALSCNDEVLSNGSVKGKWSTKDKQTFRKEMENIEELEGLGEYKSAWIECYLEKCEQHFDSYYSANQDEKGCTKIATECTEELY